MIPTTTIEFVDGDAIDKSYYKHSKSRAQEKANVPKPKGAINIKGNKLVKSYKEFMEEIDD